MNTRNDSTKYITSEEFKKMNTEEKIKKMAEGLEVPAGKDKNLVLDSIFSKTETQPKSKSFLLRYYFQAAAAVIILLIGFYSVSKVFSNQKIVAVNGMHSELTLPDGSQVTLNSDSKLTWNKRKFGNDRIVSLSGEGYFNIKKGDKFIIKTKNGTVKILGTQLNVFSRGEEFWVTCITGKVAVDAAGTQQILLPGEMAELTPEGLGKRSLKEINHTSSWKDGIFYFEDKPLVSIFGEIERQFDVSIQYQGNTNRSITVSFTNKKLEEALDVVCIPMGLKYEVDNKNNVRISEITN